MRRAIKKRYGRAKKYRAPWYVAQRWAVESLHNGQWQTIYTGATRAKVEADAAAWRAKTGKQTRIVPGSGHKSRRS